MTIDEKIKYLRKNMNITGKQLADKSNIHPVTIRKYETNKMKPQPNQIEKLAHIFNVSPYVLINSEITINTLWWNVYNQLEQLRNDGYELTEIKQNSNTNTNISIVLTLKKTIKDKMSKEGE